MQSKAKEKEEKLNKSVITHSNTLPVIPLNVQNLNLVHTSHIKMNMYQMKIFFTESTDQT